jgi:hypothetical protein
MLTSSSAVAVFVGAVYLDSAITPTLYKTRTCIPVTQTIWQKLTMSQCHGNSIYWFPFIGKNVRCQ